METTFVLCVGPKTTDKTPFCHSEANENKKMIQFSIAQQQQQYK